jgi:hypothetical protein
VQAFNAHILVVSLLPMPLKRCENNTDPPCKMYLVAFQEDVAPPAGLVVHGGGGHEGREGVQGGVVEGNRGEEGQAYQEVLRTLLVGGHASGCKFS